jgi:hypothetical protein
MQRGDSAAPGASCRKVSGPPLTGGGGSRPLDKARADLEALQRRRAAALKIGPPSPFLMVRGGDTTALVPANDIPASAVEYHVAGYFWRPIPQHWRSWFPEKRKEFT